MAAATPQQLDPSTGPDASIKEVLATLDGLLDAAPQRSHDPAFFDELDAELRRLHARVRMHHAIDQFSEAQAAIEVPPELTKELHRLRDEHSLIIGQLDRLIRCVGSMADRPQEDKDVFFLRGRELVAFIRRHEAEEDRLFYLAVWYDTGGES